MRYYLVFVGLTTVPIKARSRAEALNQVLEDYEKRGIVLGHREVRCRLARPKDAGWLRDAGAAHVADAISV